MLPYDAGLVAQVEAERAAARKLVPTTATHYRYARAIADHLQLFAQAFASEGDVNLSAHQKRNRIVGAFSDEGFD